MHDAPIRPSAQATAGRELHVTLTANPNPNPNPNANLHVDANVFRAFVDQFRNRFLFVLGASH